MLTAAPPSSVSLATALLQRVRAMVSVVRLSPMDTATAHGRGRERLRRVVLSALSSAAARGVAMLASFVSVPFALKYLGNERYGLWMTVSSIAATLSFADFGMGNGLMSAVAKASGNNDRREAARSVASAFYMLTGVAILVLGLAFAASSYLPWFRILNVKSAIARSEASPAVLVFLAAFALSLPLGVVQRVQMAYQSGFQSNAWQAVGSTIGFAVLMLAIHQRVGLPWLIAAVSGGPLIAGAANSVVEFVTIRPWLLPVPSRFEWRCSSQLLGAGLAYFGIQVASTLNGSMDNIILAHYRGPSDVATYSVVSKLMGLIPFVTMLVLMPLWPAYGEAFARGDLAWARATLKRTAWLGLAISVPAATFLLGIGPAVVRKWTHGQILAPASLLLALGVASVFTCATYSHGIFLMGTNSVRFCLSTMALVAISSAGLKMLLVRPYGLEGVAWGGALPYLLLNGLPCVLYAPVVLRRAERSMEASYANV